MQELQDRVKNTGNREVADRAAGASNLQKDSGMLLKYPSLERLFEGDNSRSLAEMRSRLERTRQSLDRVIRQGPQQDAGRAARVAEAYDLALGLLAEIERLAPSRS